MDTTFNDLFSWTDINKSTHCSGTGTYEISFEVPDTYVSEDIILYLDLGKIGNIAEIFVNSKSMNTVWMRGMRTDITGAIKRGKNNLTVKITNTSINHVSGLSENPPIPEELVPRFGAVDRNGIPREYGFKPLPPSGLMGPVVIVPAKRVHIAVGEE